ncbi:hypothetical protein HDV04_003519 [Boothiomyces sp. JEL0838]|nr:hypothetical protein HDV04_003519 [Boothiomyces sp. JEL0838]
MDKLISVTRKYYNQLLLKVHPDYFANKPLIKRMNEKSIQELNLIMSNISSSDIEKLSPTDIQLATHSIQKTVKLDPFKTFTPLSIRNSLKKKEILMKSWTGEIINLCEEFGVEIGQDKQLWKKADNIVVQEKERFEDEVKAIILDQQFDAYRLPMVVYDKRLNHHQKSVAANKLVKYLNGLPWLVAYEFQQSTGIFVVPWNFDEALLKSYVKSNYDRVSIEFNQKLKEIKK